MQQHSAKPMKPPCQIHLAPTLPAEASLPIDALRSTEEALPEDGFRILPTIVDRSVFGLESNLQLLIHR
jgi:hypothetical protein